MLCGEKRTSVHQFWLSGLSKLQRAVSEHESRRKDSTLQLVGGLTWFHSDVIVKPRCSELNLALCFTHTLVMSSDGSCLTASL